MEHAKQSESLLSRADECELIAKLATTDASKTTYLNMADLYRRLAAEENKLKGSGLPVVHEK
jgi:hypothetical protein